MPRIVTQEKEYGDTGIHRFSFRWPLKVGEFHGVKLKSPNGWNISLHRGGRTNMAVSSNTRNLTIHVRNGACIYKGGCYNKSYQGLTEALTWLFEQPIDFNPMSLEDEFWIRKEKEKEDVEKSNRRASRSRRPRAARKL